MNYRLALFVLILAAFTLIYCGKGTVDPNNHPGPWSYQLEPPKNFTADIISYERVDLRWNPVEGAEKYNIYRAIGDTDEVAQFKIIATLESTSFSDLDISAYVGYKYKVTALKDSSESGYSEEKSVQTPRLLIGDIPFSDTNLKQCVINSAGQRQYADEFATLSCGYKNINSINGIRHLINLTYLGLSNNQISDVSPLAGLINLTHLYLGSNQISNISPLAGLINLTYLWLDSNQISDISPLAGLINLTYLYLHSNQISNVSPLAGLTNLTSLGLDSNQISDISPLAGLINLTYLWLDSNQISDISPLAGLINLTSLNLGANQISDVSPLAGLINLTSLNLFSNQISNGVAELVTLTSATIINLRANNQIPCADLDTLEAALNQGVVNRPTSCI